MLDFMRRNANSWVMIFLFGIIIFVFAINFGPWAGESSQETPYAAIVNNQTITMAEFRSAYTNQFARIKQFRTDYTEDQANKDGLKGLILEQLISRELLTQLGRQQKLAVGARTLAEEIKERVFGPDKEFNKEEYQRIVPSFFGTTIAGFETLVEKELIAQQMADILSTAVFISDEEVKQGFIDKNTKVAIEFVKVNPALYKSERKVPPQEIGAFIEKNPARIATYYNENLSQFVKDKEVKASHILVKVAPTATAEEKDQLKAKAQALLERIKKGENFAEVAQKESEDLGSKEKGGDLGFFNQGMMVAEFAKAAFALNIDEVSEIVESPFGFHIIKLTDKMDATTTTQEAASNEIAEILIRTDEQKSKARVLADQALAQLKSGVPLEKIAIDGLVNMKTGATQTASLAPVADESGSFNRASTYIQKIGKADEISNIAFKLDLANPTANEVIESNGQLFAIRLKSREEADLSKFDAEKESLKQNLTYPRRRAFMQQYLAHLKSKAKITYNKSLTGDAEANL